MRSTPMKGVSLLLGIAVVLLVGLALSACGNGDAESDATGGTAMQAIDSTASSDSTGAGASPGTADLTVTYPIVDTNQGLTYNNSEQIDPPAEGEPFYGQGAQYTGNVPSYTDNGDGTVTDNVTGLVWAQELSDSSMPWSEASSYCESLELAGYDDWRLPTVKELWSIRDFSRGWPWVDTDYFYLVGDGSDQRQQHSWTSNLYLVESEHQNEQVQGDPTFIVNDWTGHTRR